MEKLKKLFKFMTKIEIAIISILFVMMIACIFIQVINRNITKLTINWTEELARYCMIYVAMLGAEIGLRDGSQMCVEMFSSWFPQICQGFIDIIGTIINAFFCSVAGYASVLLILNNFQSGQTSPNLHMPMWIPYLAVTISLFVMALAQIYKLGTQIYWMSKTKCASSSDPSVIAVKEVLD